MNAYLHGPMDYSKTLELRVRVGDVTCQIEGKRYTNTSSRVEEEEGA